MHIFFVQVALDKLFLETYRGRLSLAIAIPCGPVYPAGIDAPCGMRTPDGTRATCGPVYPAGIDAPYGVGFRVE
jgi:hypothetical protein